MSNIAQKTLVGLALVTATLAVAPSAPASAAAAERGGTSCNAKTYTSQYKLVTVNQGAVITQIGARTLPPGGLREVTAKVETKNTVRAGGKVNGEVSASVGNRFIGKAEFKTGFELSASGESTTTRSTTVTESVANKTSRNQKYVFFRGTTKVAGTGKVSYCNAYDGSGGGRVVWRDASFTTFTFVDEGTAQCGAGATGAVPKAALAIGCR